MKDRNCEKAQYTCGVCGTSYDSVQERMNCEMACVKKIQEEERKAAEAKKKEAQKTRKVEVDNALQNFIKLATAYSHDYGKYDYNGQDIPTLLWPNKLWHHFWF